MFQPGKPAPYVYHEIRQPLAAVLTNAQAALRWLDRDQPDLAEARQAIERIVGSSLYARDIVNNAPALADAPPPAMPGLNINRTIEDMIDVMFLDLRRWRIEVETALAPGLAPVRGDRHQMQQVVANLATNGIEAMIAVEDRPRRLKLATGRHGAGGVVVSVADSGICRPAGPPLGAGLGGMGVGLSICRSIVDAHGGRLWAEPNLPHGSIHRVALPIVSS